MSIHVGDRAQAFCHFNELVGFNQFALGRDQTCERLVGYRDITLQINNDLSRQAQAVVSYGILYCLDGPA